jgi:hypothetical protein
MARPVDVTITNNQVSVDPDPLTVTGSNAALQWNITTGGWTFPSDGIDVANGAGEFYGGNVVQNGTRYVLTDRNSVRAQDKYTVKVTNGTQTLTLDPIIINDA